jgi:hypothetical protein
MKKLLAVALLFISSIVFADLKEYPIFDFSGGLYTNDQPERIGDKYTPDCLNAWLDRDSGLVKRQGYNPFLSFSLPEKQSIRCMYEYRNNDGTRYMIFNSSWSVYYAKSNGIPVSILGGQNPVNTDNYTTGNGFLLRDNGTTSGKFDGSAYTPFTVSNSTGMIYGKYNVYYKDHWFKAGVSGFPSVIYWSVVNDIGDFYNYGAGSKFVGKDDGDVITALWPTPNGLMIFKKYATYILVGSDPQTWLIQNISQSIGCLYQSTVQNYLNYPMLMSWRGIELFDGINFNLISTPIDNYMRSLNQLVASNQATWSQHSSVDWGAGSGVNIDTVTFNNSVAISSRTVYVVQQSSVDWGNASYSLNTDITTLPGYVINKNDLVGSSNYLLNKTVSSGSSLSADTHAVVVTGSISSLTTNSAQCNVRLTSGNGFSATEVFSVGATATGLVSAVETNYSMDSTVSLLWLLVNGVTYHPAQGIGVVTVLNSPVNNPQIDLVFSCGGQFGPYTGVVYLGQIKAFNAAYEPMAKIATQTLDFGRSISRFSVFEASISTPTGTAIGFSIRSSANGSSWGSWSDLNLGDVIPSTPNEYIQVIATMTTTQELSTPMLESMSISAYDYGNFTSQTFYANPWISWGNFSVNDYQNPDNSIFYYVKTATSSFNIANAPAMLIQNGSPIASSTGPYITIIASFTRTDVDFVPRINSTQINYYTSNTQEPTAQVYRDGYWLAVSTDSSTGINNVVIHYDRYGRFTLHNDIYMASSCLFYNGLYTGSSNSEGQIFHQDIPNLYADRGSSYQSYYKTKVFDCGLPANEKNFHYLMFFAKNSGIWNAYCKYQLNEQGNFSSMDNVDLSVSQSVVQKIKIPDNTTGNYIQFMFGNDTSGQSFSIRGLDLIYDPYPIQ